MHTTEELFGPIFGDSDAMAHAARVNPTTPTAPAFASTEEGLRPSEGFRGLLDPKGSALFWIGLAAVLGLSLVTGQLKVSAALKGGRT